MLSSIWSWTWFLSCQDGCKMGCFICLVLVLGWACASYVRNREIKLMNNTIKADQSSACYNAFEGIWRTQSA
ncbi:hypothetical protein M5689_006585 [Euphorbia peplus]|nr:hypothetical protein M5689_006585 [Euphorbia peplus]